MNQHWNLNPKIDFFNHGSFGATPKVVLQAQCSLVDQLERDPIEFLAPERSLLPRLDAVRRDIAGLIGASPDGLAFVRNATDGVNAVLRSFRWAAGDEVLITDHGYNACSNAARFAAEQAGAHARVAKIPFPIGSESEVIERIEGELTDRTRLLLIDHVTSPTGLIFPIEGIIKMAKAAGVRVLVDGAHAPGMVEVDLSKLNADYYTANHHKWLCAPKASGFLYVDEAFRDEVRPTVISHGANRLDRGRTRFQTEFDWIGTYDPTPLLAVSSSLRFLESLFPGGINELMRRNRNLALHARSILLDAMGIDPPSPESMIGSLASIPIEIRGVETVEQVERFQKLLREEHRFEVPLFRWGRRGVLLRISAQAYNTIEQFERLAGLLADHQPDLGLPV